MSNMSATGTATGMQGEDDAALRLMDEHLTMFATRAAYQLRPDRNCSITVRDPFGLRRSASSEARAAYCDEVETADGSGPCIDAMEELRVVLVPDLADEVRWGAWTAAARAVGFRSAVAFPAHVRQPARAALNVYSEQPDHWDRDTIVRCDVYAQQIAAVLDLCLGVADLEQKRRRLQEALLAQKAIDQAVGAIMATQRCDAADALLTLQDAARQGDAGLTASAAQVLHDIVARDPYPH